MSRTPAPAGKSLRLLLVRSSLGLDGGATRFLALAKAVQAMGGDARILSPSGPLAERAAKAGVLELLDWPQLPPLERLHCLEHAARGAFAIVTCCLPTNISMIPALALHTPVHLCVHATPAALGEAFGEDSMAALGSVLKALHQSGRVFLTAASEVEAREHERRLGLDPGTLAAFPHGVELSSPGNSARSGPIRKVALVSRLERIKLPHVAAAAHLVAAGRATGAEVILEVHGEGSAESEAAALLEAILPSSAFSMSGPTNEPLAVMQGADVVVGGGRTCLEALSVGRRAAVCCATRPGSAPAEELSKDQLGAPVTPATLDKHLADNFNSMGRPAVRATQVWEILESLPVRDVARMQDRVRAEYSADAMLARELGLLGRLSRRPSRPDLLLRAAVAYSAHVEEGGVHGRYLRAVADDLRHQVNAERAAADDLRRQMRAERTATERKHAAVRASDSRRNRNLLAARTALDTVARSRTWRLSRRAALVLHRLRGRRGRPAHGLERARHLVNRALVNQGEQSGG